MKILKYGLGIIAALVIIFFLIGIFKPSFTYESKILVHKPVAHTFAVFNDETRMGEWMDGFVSIETISGNPNEVGSKYRLVIEDHGEEMVMIEEMKDFKENELFAFTLDNDVLLNDVEITFVPVNGNQTEITALNKIVGKNLFWKSLLPLFKSTITENRKRSMISLKL